MPGASEFLGRVRKHIQHWRHKYPDPESAPLVGAGEMNDIAAFASTLPALAPQVHYPSAHREIGDALSVYRGQGFDFDENRPWQMGDEQRLINWRLYARTASLFSRVFIEERHPHLYVLLDRRARMAFGTRKQLKASLAARIACSFLYRARRSNMRVGGLILNGSMDWFSPTAGADGQSGMIDAMVAPCPPKSYRQDEPAIAEALRYALERFVSGSIVVLIGDFSDLEPETASPLLTELASRCEVQAWQIHDPVERQLPGSGTFLIEDTAAGELLEIDASDAQMQDRYRSLSAERQNAVEDCFYLSGVKLRQCSTIEDYKSCLEMACA